MYPINDVILDAFRSQSREFEVKVRINNGVELTGENIIDYKISDSILPDNNFALGTTCSAKLELNMLLPENSSLALERAKLEMFVGVKIEGVAQYVPMGVYYVDNVETKDNYKTVHITAFDAMLKIGELGNTYTCNNFGVTEVSPTTIIRDICDKARIKTKLPPVFEFIDKHNVEHCERLSYDYHGNILEYDRGVGIRNKIKIPYAISTLNPNAKVDLEIFISKPASDYIYSQDFGGGYPIQLRIYDSDTGGHRGDVNVKMNDPSLTITETALGKIIKVPVDLKTYPISVAGYLLFESTPPPEVDVSDCTFDFIYKDEHYNYPEDLANIRIPTETTYNVSPREMLGYMASLLGRSAKINRNGELVLKLLTTGDKQPSGEYHISRSDQVMNGLTKSTMSPLTIDYLVTGTDNTSTEKNHIVATGEGDFGFNFSNPFVKETKIAEAILNIYQYQLFYPISVNIIGNPYLEVGDYINVEDRDGNLIPTIILSLETKVSGGFRQSIKCQPDLKNNNKLIANPVTQTISRKNSSFMELYQSLINALVGVDGGYVKLVYDSQKKVRAIAIPLNDVELKWEDDQSGHGGKVVTVKPVLGTVEPMWVFSGGGLAFTNDGGRTYEVAMNTKGQIFANYLLSPEGNIGGWTISDDALYNDQTVTTASGKKTYRSYMQGARDSYNENTWVYSVQEETSPGFFVGKWIVKANGDMHCQNFDANTIRVSDNITIDGDLWTYSIYGRPVTDSEGNKIRQLVIGGTENIEETFIKSPTWFDENVTIQRGAGLDILDQVADDVSNISTGKIRLSKWLESQAVWTYNLYGRWTSNSEGVQTRQLVIGGSGDSESLFVQSPSWFEKDVHIQKGAGLSVNGVLKAENNINLSFRASSGTIPLVVDTAGNITTNGSSERFKENIKPVSEELNPNKLYDLPIKQYNYKDEFNNKSQTGGTEIGIIAEDLDKVYPNAVIYDQEGKPSGWHDGILIPAMLKLIQDQHKEIEDLKTRLDKLEKGDKK